MLIVVSQSFLSKAVDKEEVLGPNPSPPKFSKNHSSPFIL